MLKKGGFSLLEVLVAIVIFTIGVTALMQALSAGIFATSDVEDVRLALNIAQDKMEEINNTSFASIADSGPTPDSNFTKFSVTVAAATGNNPMQVDVTVSWNVKGKTANVALTTLVANYA